MTRLVFLGTPAAAVPTLERLADRVTTVITRPDRPRGRSRRPQPSPVKTRALELGIPVAQPETPAEVAAVVAGAGSPDLGVVVAYGMLLDDEALTAPRLGHVNIHFSLLPRWRGAGPVQAALLAGDDRTGVTLMRLERGLDTGPIFSTLSTAIGPDENAGSLTRRLSLLGADLIESQLEAIVEGRRRAAPQTGHPTYAPKTTAADRPLDLSRPASTLNHQIRALAPAPGATVLTESGPMKILAARTGVGSLAVGEVGDTAGEVTVGTGDGVLLLDQVQPAGGRVMSAVEWWRGARVRVLR